MKVFLFLVCFFSITSHAAQSTGRDKLDRSEIIEKRQSKARAIYEDNFNALERLDENKNLKPNFGFKKDNDNNQKL